MDEIRNNKRSATFDPPDEQPASLESGLAQELRSLADDIAAFVLLHKSRLQRLVDAPRADAQCADAPCADEGADEDFDRRQFQLEARERELDQRQRDSWQHVEDECAQLTAAWDRLEAEQRRLLARGESSVPTDAAPQPAAAVPAAASAIAAGDIDLIGDFDMPAANSAVNPDSIEPWSREPAARQFQQMKREIRRHARRRKR